MGTKPGPIAGVPVDADQSWALRGLCASGEYDPELFFPAPTATAQTATAVAVCARCPVRCECLEWALATNQQYGVWGGLSEEKRRALKAKRARDAKNTRRRTRKKAS
jgi:WhiB family redox-sensing transcriptional regulator